MITSLLSPTNEKCHLTCLTIIFYILAMKYVLQRYKRTHPGFGATSQKVSSSSNNGRKQIKRIKRRWVVRSMKLVSIIIVALLLLSGPIAFLGKMAFFSQMANLLLSFDGFSHFKGLVFFSTIVSF